MACLQSMKTFRMIHYLAGFYTGEECLPVYKVYRNLTDGLIFAVLSSTVYQLLTSPLEHKESLSVSCVVCIAYSLALYYSLCFQVQYQKISQLFSLLEKIRVSLSDVTDEGAILKYFQLDMKRYTRNTYFGLFASFMSAFLFSVQPLLRSAAFLGMDGNKQLQINIWCPFDLQTGYLFEATVTIQFFTVFWVALRFFANDSFFMFLMKANIRLFEHLIAFEGRVIELNPVLIVQRKQAGQESRNRLNLRLLQPILEHGQFGDNLGVQVSEIRKEIHMEQSERNMNLFIKNHQLILRCSSETCKIYGPVMLMYLLSLMGFASTGAFGVLHTNGFQGIQSVAVSFFSVANLLFLYLMSRTGDDLSQKYLMSSTGDDLSEGMKQYPQSGEVGEKIYGSSWYACSKKFRTSLVLLTQRVNTTVQPCVIGVPSMPLSCTTFAWFIKTMVSFYLFLVQVQGIKNA